jgi:hypothetical protein
MAKPVGRGGLYEIYNWDLTSKNGDLIFDSTYDGFTWLCWFVTGLSVKDMIYLYTAKHI